MTTMDNQKKQYFLKLNPPRPTFTVDMTDEERAIMYKHIEYWAPYVLRGTMIVMGPVMDPKGGYGVGVIEVDSEEELNALLANDPANGLNSYEAFPMRAVRKQE